MTKRNLSLLILAVSTTGFVMTFQKSGDSILWGLLSSAFGAAMVGGLADWFAITALFNKIPLDSHSDILRNKREELTDAIVDFATKDLLTVENIKDSVEKTRLSGLLVRYLTKCQGKEKMRRTVQTAAKSILRDINLAAIVKKLEPDIRRSLREGTAEKLMPKIGNMVVESRHTQDFFRKVIEVGKNVYNQPEFQKLLRDNIETMGKRYDERGFGRETIRSLALSNEALMELLNHFANEWLDTKARDADNVYRSLKEQANSYFHSEEFMEFLLDKKEELLANDDVMEWIHEKVKDYQENNRPEMLQMVDNLVVWGLDSFIASKEWQAKVDAFLKDKVNSAVAENHENLGGMIRKKLAVMDDDEIVKIVEDAAGDDIHAIRISGSLVGGTAGTALYIVGTAFHHLWR